MFDYDSTLKLLLRGSAEVTIRAISGLKIAQWLDGEFPKVDQRRVDLLGEVEDGSLLHLELQNQNDASMPFRMLEYGVRVAQRYKRYPAKQVVLYVGQDPMRMESEYRANDLWTFRYEIVDMRDLDGELLLASAGMEDNVLAILAKVRNRRRALRQIMGRLAQLDKRARGSMVEQLSILAGLRELEPLMKEESIRMPITEDIMNHKIIGPAIRQGRQEGERIVLRRLLTKRFGEIPEWLDRLLENSSTTDLEALSDRILDARSIEDFRK